MFPVDLGRFQLGTEVPLMLQCTLSGEPDVPSTHPTAEVRRDSTGVVVGIYDTRVPADAQGVVAGFFRRPLLLSDYGSGGAFSAGRYTVTYRWKDSLANNRVAMRCFQVVPGGSADGSVVAMHPVERPQARYLLQQTDGGLLKKGKNPR